MVQALLSTCALSPARCSELLTAQLVRRQLFDHVDSKAEHRNTTSLLTLRHHSGRALACGPHLFPYEPPKRAISTNYEVPTTQPKAWHDVQCRFEVSSTTGYLSMRCTASRSSVSTGFPCCHQPV